MGDYVDDWHASSGASYNIVKGLVDWASEDDRVILLLGNHDLSEWLDGIFNCPGFNKDTHNLVEPLFRKNQHLFKIAYNFQDILFTHGGLTSGWIQDMEILGFTPLPKESSAQEKAEHYATFLNWAFNKRGIDDKATRITKALTTVGPARCLGSCAYPSPIWADFREIMRSPVSGISQVVGHTPVDTITHFYFTDTESRQIIACDTHSTYQYGENIGDNSLLEIIFYENGVFTDKTIKIDI